MKENTDGIFLKTDPKKIKN